LLLVVGAVALVFSTFQMVVGEVLAVSVLALEYLYLLERNT
jgi:hypothetical protein